MKRSILLVVLCGKRKICFGAKSFIGCLRKTLLPTDDPRPTALQCITVILNGPCYLHVIFITYCWLILVIKLYLLSVRSRTLNFTLQKHTIRSLNTKLWTVYLSKFHFRNSSWYFDYSSIPWLVLPPAVAFPLQSNYRYGFPHSTNWARRQTPFLQASWMTSSMLQYRLFFQHVFSLRFT